MAVRMPVGCGLVHLVLAGALTALYELENVRLK